MHCKQSYLLESSSHLPSIGSSESVLEQEAIKHAKRLNDQCYIDYKIFIKILFLFLKYFNEEISLMIIFFKIKIQDRLSDFYIFSLCFFFNKNYIGFYIFYN